MSRYTVGLCAQLEDFSETHFRFSRKANVLDRGVAIFTELDAEVASVMADALNIHEATGLTPSQLLARVVELEAALRDCLGVCQAFASQNQTAKLVAQSAETVLGLRQ